MILGLCKRFIFSIFFIEWLFRQSLQGYILHIVKYFINAFFHSIVQSITTSRIYFTSCKSFAQWYRLCVIIQWLLQIIILYLGIPRTAARKTSVRKTNDILKMAYAKKTYAKKKSRFCKLAVITRQSSLAK